MHRKFIRSKRDKRLTRGFIFCKKNSFHADFEGNTCLIVTYNTSLMWIKWRRYAVPIRKQLASLSVFLCLCVSDCVSVVSVVVV